MAAAGAVLGLLIFGARDASGYGATFLMTVPGFAYGYFQPEGKPVEYWFLVVLRYHFTAQRFGGAAGGSTLHRLYRQAVWLFSVVKRARQMAQQKEVPPSGRR